VLWRRGGAAVTGLDKERSGGGGGDGFEATTSFHASVQDLQANVMGHLRDTAYHHVTACSSPPIGMDPLPRLQFFMDFIGSRLISIFSN
jgi:hypothetical protein